MRFLVDCVDEWARLGAGELNTIKVAQEPAGHLLSA